MPGNLSDGDHDGSDKSPSGSLASDNDSRINAELAEWMFNLLGKVPSKTLDICIAHPLLAGCLRTLGCDAHGLEARVRSSRRQVREAPMVAGGFDDAAADAILAGTSTPHEKFRLITLIHSFQCLHRPIDTLIKLRHLVADDGFVFLRLPDHSVAGYERDLTPSRFAAHPFFYSLPGVLELLVVTEDKFDVLFTRALDGSGQRDIVLRPLMRKPTVLASMIVKNEERDLPRALMSVASVVDGVVIADTGSTDGTGRVVEEMRRGPYRDKLVAYFSYFDASEQDERGEWKLWDFGKARNASLDRIAESDADWVLWLDADDELLTPRNLQRAIYLGGQYSVFAVWIKSAGDRWRHHRLWRNKLGIVFEGPCHEYPTVLQHPCMSLTDSVILHHAEPGAGESSNARNLRILKRASDASPTPRIAFYLANTYKDAGRFVEAIDCYAQRIAFGPGYRDEWLFAHLYKARMERAAGRISEAKSTLFAAIGAAPDWSEFWMELSYIYYDERRYEQSIGAAFLARGHAPPATELWRELNKYADQPLRIISWCYEHMGDIANALKWAEAARATIGLSDVEWEDRIRRLQGPADATRAQGSRSAALPKPAFPARSIALHRPGAIGDILMTLNLLPLLRNKHPGARLSYYCHPTIANAMAELFRAVGVDEVIDSALFHADAARHDLRINLIGYPLAEGYPDRPMRKHLLEYFADEMAIELPSDRITGGTILPSLELPQPARLETLPAGPYATVEVDTGWSVYREWPIDRWAEVLSRTPQMRVYQIGVHTDPKVRGACHEFMGTPLATAIRLFAHATLHLGVDSFANHLTNYTWQPLHQGRPSGAARRVRGIILWGSTQASAAGYGRNANLVSPQTLACQPCFREDPSLSQHPRGLCINPPGQTRYDDPRHQCMRNITVEQVAQVVAEAWRTAT